MKQQILSSLFGAIAPGMFISCLVFLAIGSYLSLNFEANKRNVDSNSSPKHFSYRILLQQNWQRILTNGIAGYIIIRFYPDFFGSALSEFGALCAGLGIDRVIMMIKNAGKK